MNIRYPDDPSFLYRNSQFRSRKNWNCCQPRTCDGTLATISLPIRSSPSFSRSLSQHPPSPAWRVANRAIWRSFGHFTMVVFELAFRIPPRPQIPSPLNTLFHDKTALSLSVILDKPQVRDTSGRPRVTRARKSVGLRGARRPDGRFPSKCTPPPIPTTNPGPKRPSTFRARRIQPKLHTNSKLL